MLAGRRGRSPIEVPLSRPACESGEWLRNLHSNFRLGTWVGTVTELAASLALVSLATGLYLWWPRTRAALRRSLVPRLRGLLGGGRRPWRDLHASLGVLTVAALAVMVVTGLTWTEYAGRWVDVAKAALTADAPVLHTKLSGAAGPRPSPNRASSAPSAR